MNPIQPANPIQPMNPVPPVGAPKRSVFKWLVLVILLLIIAAGAWYYYSGYFGGLPFAPSAPAAGTSADTATEELGVQGTSDEVDAIEQDLQATDLNDLDRELSDIGTELAR